MPNWDRPAKVGHRKSRNGCLKCKARRVKCDELQPACTNCTRLRFDCTWPEHALRPMQARWSYDQNPFAQLDDDQGISLPESKARRMLEHRLLQNWYQNLNRQFPMYPHDDWRDVWVVHIPRLSLQHENMLHAMLATSATNLLSSHSTDRDLFAARQSYIISALSAQRREVQKLSAENAEAVCMGSLLISITSFAMLRERSLDPYQPPMEWLQLGRGAGTVIWQSVEAIVSDAKEGEYPALMTVATAYPHFGRDQSYFSPEMRRDFNNVLTQRVASGDDWNDEETREAYEKTLSYVGSIQKGINDGEPIYALTRRIQTFALIIPPRFVGLLSLQRPRALVVLAHFWATVSQVHNVWWLGGISPDDEDSTAKREIRAIKTVLPKEWLPAMLWPLDRVNLRDDVVI
ncbi:hypothetical protein M406DRAFT_269754 [Cryphonectria parasitica EP155]|uniref:Zn(2)-C6 fungal-type domain-containing protein n=1 Tax=Cryphonectria parasitica (strain ATCC 38755 / EP155) TaxID=660469 RepID=A0A9P4XSN0_CRYP1|nr:uncharacterized protein M406DRAFT_269754 [Cryphonectria parasitica EP155]KAF3760030.1 hypothetical protein M406DRAFT_269754 [Cryphonectria parasitica EP155]